MGFCYKLSRHQCRKITTARTRVTCGRRKLLVFAERTRATSCVIRRVVVVVVSFDVRLPCRCRQQLWCSDNTTATTTTTTLHNHMSGTKWQSCKKRKSESSRHNRGASFYARCLAACSHEDAALRASFMPAFGYAHRINVYTPYMCVCVCCASMSCWRTLPMSNATMQRFRDTSPARTKTTTTTCDQVDDACRQRCR